MTAHSTSGDASETRTFESPEHLARHLLDRLLPYCSTQAERYRAAVCAAHGAIALWKTHA